MKRDEFITILMTSTPTELNEYIEKKGKDGKDFCPVVFHKQNIDETKSKQEESINGKMQRCSR